MYSSYPPYYFKMMCVRVVLGLIPTTLLTGSTVVSPYDNLQPIELGGSIFVKANKNLWRAVEEFSLERSDFEDEKSVMGIWDGQEFVLTVRLVSVVHIHQV